MSDTSRAWRPRRRRRLAALRASHEGGLDCAVQAHAQHEARQLHRNAFKAKRKKEQDMSGVAESRNISVRDASKTCRKVVFLADDVEGFPRSASCRGGL